MTLKRTHLIIAFSFEVLANFADKHKIPFPLLSEAWSIG